MGGQWYDANISIPGCDKNMPGCLIAMGRAQSPVADGLRRHDPRRLHWRAQKLDIVSAFQCYGEYLAGKIDDADRQRDRPPSLPRRRRLRRHVHGQHHGLGDRSAWACPCPTVRRSRPKIPAKLDECLRAGAAIRVLLERDIKPRDIMTRAGLRERDGASSWRSAARPTPCCT